MREGWEIKKLGEVADLQRGLTYSKVDEVPFSSKRVLRSNNIDLENMQLDLTELKFLREDFEIPADRKVKKNSIFICMSNGSKQHVGKVAFIEDDIDYAFGGFMGLIVPRKEVFPKYVFYSCRSSAYRLFLSGIGNGIGITNLRFTDLANYSIPVPPIAAQERIVAELDLLSGAVEKQKRQLKELDALAQAIFYDMFGDPITNEKGWETDKVINVVSLQRGFDLPVQSRTPGQIPIYGSNGVIGFHNEPRVKDGIITGRSGTIGLVYCCESPFWPLNTTLFSYNTHGNNLVYLKYLLTAFNLKRFAEGAGVPTLNRNSFHNEPIIVVPIDLQTAFAGKIEAIERQKDLIKKSIAETETLFASRMDYWFG